MLFLLQALAVHLGVFHDMALDIYEKATKEGESVDNIDHLGEMGEDKMVVGDCVTLDSSDCAVKSVKSNGVDNSIEKRPKFCGRNFDSIGSDGEKTPGQDVASYLISKAMGEGYKDEEMADKDTSAGKDGVSEDESNRDIEENQNLSQGEKNSPTTEEGSSNEEERLQVNSFDCNEDFDIVEEKRERNGDTAELFHNRGEVKVDHLQDGCDVTDYAREEEDCSGITSDGAFADKNPNTEEVIIERRKDGLTEIAVGREEKDKGLENLNRELNLKTCDDCCTPNFNKSQTEHIEGGIKDDNHTVMAGLKGSKDQEEIEQLKRHGGSVVWAKCLDRSWFPALLPKSPDVDTSISYTLPFPVQLASHLVQLFDDVASWRRVEACEPLGEDRDLDEAKLRTDG